MKAIIGLGNPGKKYKLTRHNVGFMIIENLKSKIENFSNFKFSKKFKAEISEGYVNNEKVLFVKPQTFMNQSGQTVQALVKFYKLKPKDLLIIYDDIDLLLGKIRMRDQGGSAGHKGMQSIIDALKTKKISRLRIGVCPQRGKPQIPLDKFILQKFNSSEIKIVGETIRKTFDLLKLKMKL